MSSHPPQSDNPECHSAVDDRVHITRMLDDFFMSPVEPATNHEEWLLRLAGALLHREAAIVSMEEGLQATRRGPGRGRGRGRARGSGRGRPRDEDRGVVTEGGTSSGVTT